jgi:hypothetical protein
MTARACERTAKSMIATKCSAETFWRRALSVIAAISRLAELRPDHKGFVQPGKGQCREYPSEQRSIGIFTYPIDET